MLALPYDGPGTLLAAAIGLPLLLCPGAVFAQGLAMPGWREARTRLDRMALSVLCTLACLPVLLDLAGRFGPWPTVAVAVALAIPGAALLARRAPEAVPARCLAVVVAAIALYGVFSIGMMLDWPVAGGAVRSVLMADYVKHATATRAIADAGTPPYDPTFLTTDRPAIYYYFYYTLPAVTERLGLGTVEGRHAAFGLAAWTGPILFALARTVYRQARIDRPRPGAWSVETWLVVLLLTTGLDILGVGAIGILSGGQNWLEDFEQWNEQVAAWLTSALWVPHHVAGLVAALVALMALAAEDEAPADPARSLRRVGLAGLALASLAGLSIYLAMGAGLTLALWLGRLAWRRHWWSLARVLAAGLVALALAGSWLATIVRGRVLGADPPLTLGVRRFVIADTILPPDSLIQSLTNLLALPLSYGLEFGAFAIGAAMYWRTRREEPGSELAQLLVLAALSSFLIGSFLRSSVLFNDLGWRVMLFAQLAMLLWTLAALRSGFVLRPVPTFDGSRRAGIGFLACMAIGFVGEAYGMTQYRWNRNTTPAEAALVPQERAAWAWLDRTLPAGTVVQERPDPPRNRAYGYGLYGRFRTAVSDPYNGILFGAPSAAVAARVARLSPIFSDPGLSRAEAMARAAEAGIGVLVVTARDPVFAAPGAWPQRAIPIHAEPGVRAFAVSPEAQIP
ncbi:hypothetical protein [Methylobacterium sp. JK268]